MRPLLVSVSPSTFDCANLGENTVILTVQDSHGNTASAPATVTVVDNIPPTVITKNITVALDDKGYASVSAHDIDNGSSDNCSIASMSLKETDFNCDNIGPNEVTLTVTDQSGNSATGTATVTVEDHIAPVPVVTDLPDIIEECAVTLTPPTATDNCKGTVTATTTSPLTYNEQGTYTIHWTYDDRNGNIATQDQQVIVKDVTNPTIIAPPPILNQPMDAGSCTASKANINLGTPITADNCTVVSVTNDAPDIFPSGTTIVTWTVKDEAGNIAQIPQPVTVIDNQLPEVFTKNATVFLDASGHASITTVDINNGSRDNCTITSYDLDNIQFNCSNLGPNTVKLTVTDEAGNQASATAIVTVEDHIAPIVHTQNLTIQLDATGHASITAGQINDQSTDNCSMASSKLDKTDFGCSDLGANTVTLTVTDGSGNSATATAVVMVEDHIAPVPVVADLPNITEQCAVTVTSPTATDNCKGLITATTTDPLTYTEQGTYTIHWKYDDSHGNSTTQDQNVIIADVTNPTITAPAAITAQPMDAGTCSASKANVHLGSPVTSDNCTVASVTNDAPAVFPQGTTTVTWTVKDEVGRTATATQMVTVVDDQRPIVRIKDASVFLDATGHGTITVADIDNGSGDNCTLASMSLDRMDFDCNNVGNNTVTLTVRDASGNEATAPATVTVVDNLAPIVKIQNKTIALDPSGHASIVPTAINDGSSDNCAISTYALNKSDFDCSNIGPNEVTLIVTDVHGNIGTGTATVTVVDNTAPVPVLATLPDLTGECSVSITDRPTATDNCKGTITATTTDPLTYTTQGTHTIDWTYDDGHGNSTHQTQNVIIKDVTPPVIAAPADITTPTDAGTCSASSVSIGKPNVNDNCNGVTYDGVRSDGLPLNASYPKGLTTITWKATDIGGNTSEAIQKVVVNDKEAPVFTAPANRNVNLGSSCSFVVPNLIQGLTGTDNCGTVSFSQTQLPGTVISSSHGTSTTVMVIADDGNGNQTKTGVILTAVDVTDPTITAPAAITAQPMDAGSCETSKAKVHLGTPETADNCTVASVTNDAPDVFPKGSTIVTWTVTDAAGNTYYHHPNRNGSRQPGSSGTYPKSDHYFGCYRACRCYHCTSQSGLYRQLHHCFV